MNPSLKEIKAAKKTTTNVDLLENSNLFNENFLVGIEGVKNSKSPSNPPILWFNGTLKMEIHSFASLS